MNEKQQLLKELPSVDEILKSPEGNRWCSAYPRKYVIKAIRDVIETRRREIFESLSSDVSVEGIYKDVEIRILKLSSFSLKPVINATGVVIHTNLGRSVLSEKVLENVRKVSVNYSNLEYNLDEGRRGKRYVHIVEILKETTGAEDALVVNNNAAAVLLCLNTFAKGKEAIVSRGELVEIGGSFRVPDVMKASGAILREVGTTNKTHLHDYENAINENTAVILKVHQSNYRIIGFTEEVSVDALQRLAEKHNIALICDLGSGSMIDLRPYGIYSEPTVREFVKSDADLITFSGDKLLGGPQGGVIVGKKKYIEKVQKNQITRALRIDKLTLAAFEATLMEYVDDDKAIENIPTLNMLLQKQETIKQRANKIASRLKKYIGNADITVIPDTSKAGGGSLPEIDFPTYVVSVMPESISVNDFEELLRKGNTPIIARIKEGALLLDARTIRDVEIDELIRGIRAALY